MFLSENYVALVIFIFSCILLIAGYVVGNVLLKNEEISYEKLSSYECGFDAFSDARDPFDVKFYLIAILFIIFDVEVIFFLPWVFSYHYLPFNSFYIVYVFTFILMLGFAYEWRKGCLDWD